MPGEEFDTKEIVERSTRKATIDELAKKGFQTVKVLDEESFNAMIKQIVDNAIATKVSFLSEQERQKIYAEAKAEVEKLKKELIGMKKRAELAEDAKTKLAEEVESLQNQLELAKKTSSEDERKKGFEEGVESQRQIIEELQREKARLEEEISKVTQDLEKIKEESKKQGQKEGMELQKSVLEELHREISRLKKELEEKAKNEAILIAQLEKAKEGEMREHLSLKGEEKVSGVEYLFATSTGKREASGGSVSRPVFEKVPDFALESNIVLLGLEKKVYKFQRDALDKLRGIRAP